MNTNMSDTFQFSGCFIFSKPPCKIDRKDFVIPPFRIVESEAQDGLRLV